MLISRVSANVVACLLAVATGLTGSNSVVAAPSAVEAVNGAASALAPAQRLLVVPPANFPMETTPRCDILDNFGDPRSGGRTHAGSDILATRGQEVYAMTDGVLDYQAFAGGSGGSSLSGNLWKLSTTPGGTYYIYAHLDAFAPGLSRGSTVSAGQVIGYVGDTGRAEGCHLHFELWSGPGWYRGGKPFDPLPSLRDWDAQS